MARETDLTRARRAIGEYREQALAHEKRAADLQAKLSELGGRLSATQQAREKAERELAAERSQLVAVTAQRDEVVGLLRRWRALFGAELDALIGKTSAYADGAALWTATWTFKAPVGAVGIEEKPVVPGSASGTGEARS